MTGMPVVSLPQPTTAIWKHRFIADVDTERTGPHRHWWLDSTVDRP